MEALLRLARHPDHLPVLLMIPAFIGLAVLWWRCARRHDRLLDEGGEQAVAEHMQAGEVRPHGADAADAGGEGEAGGVGRASPAGRDGGRLHTWPYLVRVEMVAALVVLLVLTVWSILVDAPLEHIADPARTPDPSKAPWYFVGLQELLVYFDPWIAGVILPLAIIGGLCAIPYLDRNPQGGGFYCWRPRRLAISIFLGGFALWLALIVVGVFFRGSGWSWVWPWAHEGAHVAAASAARGAEALVNWPALFGIRSPLAQGLFGGLTLLSYYGLAALYWWRRRRRPALVRLGRLRYALVSLLLLTLVAVPIKITLRLLLSVKYVLVTPWFSI